MTRATSRWSPEEDRILAAHFPEHGGRWDGWAALLPDRSTNAISSRAVKKGLRSQWRTKWSDGEDAILMANYPMNGPVWDGWAALLPDRSTASIANRAGHLGVVTVRTLRARAQAARRREGAEGRRCGDCNQFVPSCNPTVDAGTCVSARLARHLGLQRRPSVLVTSDASECEFFERMQPLFRRAGGGS